MNLSELETPALVLDIERLRANAQRMLDHCGNRGVILRPHAKTSKSVDVVKLATGGRTSTITVSTLAEAEHFAQAGFSDILYAVGITPNKLARASRIGPSLSVIIDSVQMARAVTHSDFSGSVLIEIDCGEHRGGLPAKDAALEDIARALGPQFAGIMTHAGHSYATADITEVRRVADLEADAARTAANRLRQAGIDVGTVSIGSTPTVLHATSLDGITEVRAGIYLFYDLSQFGRKICRLEDLALSVLASVIGHNRDARVLTIDAGALAMSKDIGASPHLPDAGYGWLCDAQMGTPLGLSINAVHQEHGTVHVSNPEIYERLPIGSMVRVLPVHACLTAAGGYGRYHLTDGQVWPRIDGWR